MTPHTSAYEQWVMAVRAWREDPRHDMSHLPTLVVDSLPEKASSLRRKQASLEKYQRELLSAG